MIAFLNFNFLFFILFFLYFFIFFSSIFPSFFLLFFLSFFLLHTRTLTLFLFYFFPLFSLPLPPNSRTFHRALFLSLSFFIFFIPFSLFSYHFFCKFLSLYPIKTHKLKGHTQPYGEACSKEERMA